MGSGPSKDGEVVREGQKMGGRSQARTSIAVSKQASRTSFGNRNQMETSTGKFADEPDDALVKISRNGFSVPEITIMEGQMIMFVWEDLGARNNVVQVIHDGEKLRPVIGGYSANFTQCQGQYEQQFNLEGEYKFALSGLRCTPLSVVVKRKLDLPAKLTDKGFRPDIIYLDQGHSIKWDWKDCDVAHSIQEVKYCIERACFKKDPENASNVVRTVSGSHRQTFNRPGLYYFLSESSELERIHLCVVHVREAQREHKVEILDRCYQPMILLIEEGDKIWFSWDKNRCRKPHAVYEIEAPMMEHSDEEPYKPVKEGFRWASPSKQGLMAHEIYKPGVYFYSDQNFQEAAEYIGTIIVKPKQKEHYVEITETGFNPGLIVIRRLFSYYSIKIRMEMGSVSKRQQPNQREKYSQPYCTVIENFLSVSVSILYSNTIVAFSHYPQNHTVHVTDNGFEPKVITVRPNDRIWWVWQSCKKQHNIFQVSHQGAKIKEGFSSGDARDAPSAFVHQFITPGVYYFISSVMPKVVGAVVVSTQPQVHEISVGTVEIKPDPVTVQLNDIVCWVFRGLRFHDVYLVENADQMLAKKFTGDPVPPRRCLNKAITETGNFHFASKSFSKQKRDQDNFMDELKLSSVICDERFDNAVIRVDKEGFHPEFCYIQKGHSVLWTWKGNEQSHNIIHVTAPDSNEPLNMIHGAKSFNSGKLSPNNSFLYTFDELGAFSVVSQGAPGFACTVFVKDTASRCEEPYISSDMNGGTVDKFAKVSLACNTHGAKIYFTIDGMPPELHMESAKLYKPEKGVVLKQAGLTFVRAIAVREGQLNSFIYTSKRFWVISQDQEPEKPESTISEVEVKAEPDTKTWDWWGCVPNIKACFTAPGVIEIFWDLPDEALIPLVKGYQLYMNGVSYCDMFPQTNNSINASGLAGGRLYEINVVVFATKEGCAPQSSNKLMMKCPVTTYEGGPIVSLETSDQQDSLSLVWMPIDTPREPISGYLVFLDDQQCGARLVPDPDSNRCKVVIGGCELNKLCKVYVAALPRESDQIKISNVLEVILPLETSMIKLPPKNERVEEEELYTEYVEIHEGSGYLPTMDAEVRSQDKDHTVVEVESSRTRDEGFSELDGTGTSSFKKTLSQQGTLQSYDEGIEESLGNQNASRRQSNNILPIARQSTTSTDLIDRRKQSVISGNQGDSRNQSALSGPTDGRRRLYVPGSAGYGDESTLDMGSGGRQDSLTPHPPPSTTDNMSGKLDRRAPSLSFKSLAQSTGKVKGINLGIQKKKDISL
ncbi:hypothetical protein ScPMuIL_007432 [Solemya velum]